MCERVCVCTFFRAEPVLARIKENHKRIILPSIDNIKHDTFEVERYENSGHGYNWELWCMYINPPKEWWEEGDMSAPIRYASFSHLNANRDLTLLRHIFFHFFKIFYKTAFFFFCVPFLVLGKIRGKQEKSS